MTTTGYWEPLSLVDGNGIRQYNFVQIGKIIVHLPTIKQNGLFLSFPIDLHDPSDIAVEDLFVIVIPDLHNLVTNPKAPSLPGHVAF
jgi:hypothetical protein